MNETEFANQDEEISYKTMWLELKQRFKACKRGCEWLAGHESDPKKFSRYLIKADEMETALFFMKSVEDSNKRRKK